MRALARDDLLRKCAKVLYNTNVMSINRGIIFAVVAGSCAAMASVFGKMAINISAVLQPILYLLSFIIDLGVHVNNDTLTLMTQGLRILFITLVILSNILMWNMFTKAMDASGSITATVINTAANFFFTAIFGRLFFGEPLSLAWGAGATCIMIGLAIMHKGAANAPSEKKKKKEK